MNDFRSRHGDSAYLCRWIPCPRAFVGFANVGERIQHEGSAHKAQFQCRDPSCGIWFSSRKVFRRHQRVYHVKEEDWIIPEFDEAMQVDVASVTKIDSVDMVDYNKHWYESPNSDLIHRWAIQLARSTPKEERQGIELRMSKAFLQQLEDDVKPVAYHFRKLSQKEFMIKQAGALKGGNIATTTRKRKLVKNTILAQKREEEDEQEAELDMDAEISIYLETLNKIDETDAVPVRSVLATEFSDASGNTEWSLGLPSVRGTSIAQADVDLDQ